MASSRQLAAIMFTDIVGYTALMGDDEQKAFKLLQKNRQIQQPIIQKHCGHWIKEMGDGILASFQTVTDAVLCAQSIQHACNKLEDLKLRIGIHLGEVVFEHEDVFGDGVNIASRLVMKAPVGGICISESVYNNVANKKEVITRFLGEEKLKNVKEPMRIYEVILNGSTTHPKNSGLPVADKKIPDKSIAVLPFVNMSNDPEQEYFSEGMAEEILNSLAHLQDLKVAGRTSSFQFKGKNIDLREVGEKLGVHTVLEGSVRKQGNMLRVTVQLINVDDGFHLWSERYDRKMDDIFAIQDEIAYAITEKLKVTFFKNEREIISQTPTDNKEAYEFYLKGRFYLNSRGSFTIKSIPYFEKAFALDPQFALAYVGYADAHLLLALFSFIPSKVAMVRAKNAADAALKINPMLCEPYASLGFYYEFYEWNWKESKKNFLRSLEINPNYLQGQIWYADVYLAWLEGNCEEAFHYTGLAKMQEPLSAIVYSIEAVIYYTFKNYSAALQVSEMAVELDPNSYLGWRFIGLSQVGLKKFDEAKEALEQTLKLVDGHPVAIQDLIWLHYNKGDMKEANRLLEKLNAASEKTYVSPGQRGITASWFGDFDLAFQYLEDAFKEKDADLIALKYWPCIPEALRQDQRFSDLYQRIGFP